eukprot:gene15051-21127_t
MPEVLYNLVAHAAFTRPELTNLISSNLLCHVVKPALNPLGTYSDQVEGKVLRLVLSSLQHLRGVHRNFFMDPARMNKKQTKQTAKKSAAAITSLEPDVWPTVYCLEIDYLLVSKVYSHVGEPDSIYALSGKPGLEQMLRVYEHEGDWNSALGLYDVAIRSSTPGAGSAPMGADHCGVARALLKSGRFHIAQRYLKKKDNDSRTSPPCNPRPNHTGDPHGNHQSEDLARTLDLSHELSWRLGQWDEDDAPDDAKHRVQSTGDAILNTALLFHSPLPEPKSRERRSRGPLKAQVT